ncbi:TetR/AcrR family transcriptional regulator [Nocardioides bizhenqiangii]|uniref:TetR/AcrR family transcriptional regulator n=1 Tax=Nocardioides bizhenqiangii TaxID=3095076 RepID=A0ABZ0ZKU2_9ACTN|nr:MULTISPECIES: TetR/AcrR family transcriptional regulator [unclassified Nocardioides]MDZ5620475.1 TetR/AcrR family transcriptional regulator [Nocardioides sp. HM23]WQQ24843.1 TetR/AcrR family transcriptional regulator [Nocardioides sp. HM61]
MPRQQLNERQAVTVQRLLDAGLAQLAEVGPEALTIRQVAVRAGVSPATAYTYFSSKSHLLAELFHRAIVDQTPPVPGGGSATERVQAVTRALSDLCERNPHVAAGANVALLGSDPDVERLRLRIGGEFVTRFDAALGESSTPELVDALVLVFSGALLQAGMGLISYAELGDRLDTVVATILGGNR